MSATMPARSRASPRMWCGWRAGASPQVAGPTSWPDELNGPGNVGCETAPESPMTDLSKIKEHMEVIGADGTHVGTVDRIEGKRIKLTKKDSGEGKHKGHHHFIDSSLIADVEGDKVRLSANADVAVTMEQEA